MRVTQIFLLFFRNSFSLFAEFEFTQKYQYSRNCKIKMTDGLCPNLYFSAWRKYVYSTQLWIYTKISAFTQLLTDFMNLSNVSVYRLQSLSHIQFVLQLTWVARTEMGTMRPISFLATHETSYASADIPRITSFLLLWQYLWWRGIGPTHT